MGRVPTQLTVARYLHRASLLKSKSVPYGEAGSVAIPGGKTTPGIYPRCEAWGAGRRFVMPPRYAGSQALLGLRTRKARFQH